MKTLGVVLVDPVQRGELEVTDRPPGTSARAAGRLKLEEGVYALGEGIDAPICQELIKRPLKELFWHENLPSLDRRLLER